MRSLLESGPHGGRLGTLALLVLAWAGAWTSSWLAAPARAEPPVDEKPAAQAAGRAACASPEGA